MIVLGSNADLFGDVRRALLADSRFIAAGDTIHCDGAAAPLTNIYAVDMNPAEWEGWDSTGGIPDPRTMSTLMLECRSPAWVAEVGEILTRGLEAPIWFVDSADTVWPADQIDAERVALG
ncbi:hypothetical protein ACFPJ1_32420 [Kribbella qitaiheensis]|uniref:hypothetical protein n=1 Tax=Kribbella qitaiheensis TaxID=1544730 RepID=UPI00361D3739